MKSKARSLPSRPVRPDPPDLGMVERNIDPPVASHRGHDERLGVFFTIVLSRRRRRKGREPITEPAPFSFGDYLVVLGNGKQRVAALSRRSSWPRWQLYNSTLSAGWNFHLTAFMIFHFQQSILWRLPNHLTHLKRGVVFVGFSFCSLLNVVPIGYSWRV